MNAARSSIVMNEIVLSSAKEVSYLFVFYLFVVKSLVERIESCRLSRSEFDTVRLIGSGAFGEVSLVRSKATSEIFALKSLHKYDMLKRSDVRSPYSIC